MPLSMYLSTGHIAAVMRHPYRKCPPLLQLSKIMNPEYFNYKGQLLTVEELAKHSPVTSITIKQRIKYRGMNVQEAVETDNLIKRRRSADHLVRADWFKKQLETREFHEIVSLDKLSKPMREVLYFRFVCNMTLATIARKKNISREWVRRLEVAALRIICHPNSKK